MKLNTTLSQYWQKIQGTLFPLLQEELGPLSEKLQKLVTILELIRIEQYLPSEDGWPGRPPHERGAVARAFVAKTVYNMPTTRALLDRLGCDIQLRRICGWERKDKIPSESTFSRAFAEFAAHQLPQRVHQALIEQTQGDRLVGHISRDSTEIEAPEKPQSKVSGQEEKKAKGNRGKGKREKKQAQEPTRIERQSAMALEQMLADLPMGCDVGAKRNSKGYAETWIGYKLHLDVADGQIPISCILSSASLNDSQVAIPLASMSAQRVTNLYDLMDAAYDAQGIRDYSVGLGHVPIIDVNPRRNKELKEALAAELRRNKRLGIDRAEQIRYRERSTVERVNGRLKEEFGGRTVNVRGHAKVFCHLMFGIVALTVDQLMRFIT
jgi:hypothetical protein